MLANFIPHTKNTPYFPKSILTEEIFLPNHPSIKFAYYDTKEALMRLLDSYFEKPYFVKKAQQIFNSAGNRVFSTPETGIWWNSVQVGFFYSFCMVQLA